MKTLINELTDLRSKAHKIMNDLICHHGQKSAFKCDLHVLVLDDLSFLTHQPQTYGRNIVEISGNNLIDDNGYEYSFAFFPIETLLEITDHLNQKHNHILPKYQLHEDSIHVIGSHGIQINERIADQELFEYKIIDREDFLDNLTAWISEAKESDKTLMKADLEMLMQVKDDFIFSSISTNDYIYQGCKGFNQTCEALIKLNDSLVKNNQ